MRRFTALLLAALMLLSLAACGQGASAGGSGKAEQEVPSLTEIEGMTNDEAAEALSGFCRQDILDAWGKPGGGLSGLFGDIYDAPTLGGWVIVQYDIPATTSTDTDLNALPVSWVSLPAVS